MKLSQPICVVLLLLLFLNSTAGATELPDTQADTILLADSRTGEVLFSKNSSQPTYIASITKLMTAILLVESGRLEEEFTVSHFAASTPPISLYTTPGDSLPGHELLKALLIMSANDVAVVIAEGLSGSVEGFARDMTLRAHELGATNTSFMNPHGLHHADHVSSAQDVLIITRHALSHPEIRGICMLGETYLPSVERTIRSTNPILGSYPGAVGLKTGYTRAAGSCLVAVAQRDDLELIAIVLGAPVGVAGTEAQAFLDYGFSLYEEHQVIQAGMSLGTAEVERASQDIALVADASVSLVIREPSLLTTELDIVPLSAPVQDGERLGELRVFYAGEHMATVSVLAQGDATLAWQYRWEIWGIAGFVILLMLWRRGIKRRRRLARMRANWQMKRKWSY